MRTERPLPYLFVLLGLPTVAMLATAVFTLGVDPFGLYRVGPAREGFNAQKPRQKGHERMVRAADLVRLQPDALILGTSRAQVGLDPEASAWEGVARRPANAAFSDGSPYEALRYLQHTDALSPVKTVVFGADYLSFIGNSRFTSDFSETRLSVSLKKEAQWFYRLDDVPSALLSLDTLRLSRSTVLEQETPSYFFDTGRRRPAFMEARIDEQGGARGAFVWSELDYARSYVCAHPQRLAMHLADFDALVSYCQERKIRLVVLWSPSHVRSLALLDEAGLGAEQERFKQALAERARGDAFELWEFSGADPRTTAEEVPLPDDKRARTRWYWESSHYRKELGDVVLARVFGKPVDQTLAGWGEQVTWMTSQKVQARVSSELAAWKSGHPADVAELKRVLSEARQESHCEEAP